MCFFKAEFGTQQNCFIPVSKNMRSLPELCAALFLEKRVLRIEGSCLEHDSKQRCIQSTPSEGGQARIGPSAVSYGCGACEEGAETVAV